MHVQPSTLRFFRSMYVRQLLLVALLAMLGACGGPAAPTNQPTTSQAPSPTSESAATAEPTPLTPTAEIATTTQTTETSATETPVPAETATTMAQTGGQIAYVTERNIWLLDLTTNETRQLTTDGENSNPAWSPDGQMLAFTRIYDGNSEIATIRADGSELTRLTNDPKNDLLPAYAQDGTLMYARQGPGEEAPIEIIKRDAAGSETVVYTQPGGLCTPVRLSVATTTQIALSINCGRGYNAFVIDLTTNATVDISLDYAPTACVYQATWARTQPRLAVITAQDCSPQINTAIAILKLGEAQPQFEEVFTNREIWAIDWSPDDQALVFQKESRNDPDLSGLWLLSLDGKSAEPRQLIKEGNNPAWRPTASR